MKSPPAAAASRCFNQLFSDDRVIAPTQIACSNVFEFLRDDPTRAPDWKQITLSYMDEVNSHYHFIWDHFDGPARENLFRVAKGKAINKKFAFVNEDLERRGYLVSSDSRLGLYSTSFRDFVVTQTSRGSGKSGFLGGLFGRNR